MKSKNNTRKGISGSVKIKPDILKEAKEICKVNGLLMSHYVTEAVKKENIRINGR